MRRPTAADIDLPFGTLMTMTKPPRPGYWLANDGKWYPPGLHPDRVRAILDAERSAADELGQPDSEVAEPANAEVEDSVEAIDTEQSVETVEVIEPAVADESVKTSEPVETEDSVDAAAGIAEFDADAIVETTGLSSEPTAMVVDEAIDPSHDSADVSRWDRARAAPTDGSKAAQANAAEEAPLGSSVPPGEDEIDAPAPEFEPEELAARAVAEEPDSGRSPVFIPPPDDAVTAEPPVAVQTSQVTNVATPKGAFSTPDIVIPPDAPGLENQHAPPRDPSALTAIPDPFPEPSVERLVDGEERPSFLKRWWKALAVMLAVIVAANALVWWFQRDDSSTAANELNVFELAEGTCIDEPTLAEQAEVQGTVEKVSCLDPHTHEVFHTVQHPAGDFDTVLIQRFAETECVSKFETYTGTLYDRSVLNFVLLLPNEKAWDDDDRSTICALYDDSGPTTGSAKQVP